MILKDVSELSLTRENHKNRKIIFCSGSFDLTHAGHALFFEDCKKLGDILVVGVGSDGIIKKNKGILRPILNEHVRLKMIDSLKPVDYCLLDHISTGDSPLLFVDLTLEILKPEFYVINEDAFDIEYRKKLCARLGIELIVLPRSCPPEFESISATKIIEKIKRLPS